MTKRIKIMEWWNRLDCGGKNTIKICMTMIVFALLFCMCNALVSCKSCSNTANTYTQSKNDAIMALEYKDRLYGDMLRAYNHLLHRVWLDNPTYVEEVLTESDEFYTLDDMMGGQWEDTFQFYNEEDSITYHMNWDSTDGVTRVVKHVVIPEPTKSRLKEVFGDDD